MSNRNPEHVVRAHYNAIARRDRAALFETLSKDVDWELIGPAEIPIAGRRLGRDAVVEFFKTIRRTIEVREFQVGEFVRHQDKVIVFGSERFLVTATGKEWAVDWVHVHTVEDGQIKKFREYTDTSAIATAYAA